MCRNLDRMCHKCLACARLTSDLTAIIDIKGQLDRAAKIRTRLDEIIEIRCNAVLPNPGMEVVVRVIRITHHLTLLVNTAGNVRYISLEERKKREAIAFRPEKRRCEVARRIAAHPRKA